MADELRDFGELTVDVRLDVVHAREHAVLQVVEPNAETVGPDGGVVGGRGLAHGEARERACGIRLKHR